MLVLETINDVRQQVACWRQDNKKIAFVPTMGNLHAGHLSLIELAKQYADVVVVSIFVNPLQFAPNEDFTEYPRTLVNDLDQCEKQGVAAVFTPSESVLYPNSKDTLTQVSPPIALNSILCSGSRPHFFSGVATVVCKLFQIVQPDFAVFGKKDYQQGVVIQQMVADLNFPIQIIMAEIGRSADGLALSSRNQYLSADERQQALQLPKSLQQLKQSVLAKNNDYDALCQTAIQQLTAAGFGVDYVEIRCQQTLTIAKEYHKKIVILAAATLGKTRLIDNCEVEVPA